MANVQVLSNNEKVNRTWLINMFLESDVWGEPKKSNFSRHDVLENEYFVIWWTA